ncbi:hypothetical protein BC835DRAFT_1315340 [Cytidiella melzeri]|nr:hypothetical protein BC835DRAFT_1315340 [Cytidiella melzeri]
MECEFFFRPHLRRASDAEVPGMSSERGTDWKEEPQARQKGKQEQAVYSHTRQRQGQLRPTFTDYPRLTQRTFV